jgi:lysophospholipase L1-like esterase
MPPPRRRPSAPPGRRATPRPRRDAQGAAKRHAQPLRRILRWRIPPEPAGSSSAAAAKGAPRFFEIRRLRLEPGPHTLEVRPVGRGTVRLFGWVLTRSQPGVIVHNVGVTGAQASTALLGHEALITQQLQRLDPTLVVIHVGTNDAYDRRLTAARFAKRLKELIARLRPAPSPPDCVVVGAPDFGDRHWRKARRLQRRAALIRKVQRRVAIEAGCAYWDQYAAMGGRGAIRRFLRARPRWAYRDRVHLTARGYQALGRLLFQALKQAYAGYLAARPRLGVSPPRRSAKARRADREARRQWPSGVTPVRLYDPRGRALHRFFRSLVLLSKKVQQARARVLYVGDSHAAGDHLTGALRQRLQAAFGDAGHGYVHAGTPWKGYRRTGLRVGATGPWRYYYLRSRKAEPQPDDRLFGLGGISTWVTLPLPPPTDEDDGAGGSNADAGNADAESGAGDRPAATPRANVTPRANATPRADATSRPDATYGMDAGS